MTRSLINVATAAVRQPGRREVVGTLTAIGVGLGMSPALAAASSSSPSLSVRRAQLQVNGASFHVIEQGEGLAVLFVHGFPDTAETWRSQMRAVAEAGHRAVALDMRGFGASYAPADAKLYSAPHTVGDLVGVLDALGIRSAVLVGHDWGADVAARAAVMRPDRFRAIVSVSIPFQPRGEISTWDDLRRQGLASAITPST